MKTTLVCGVLLILGAASAQAQKCPVKLEREIKDGLIDTRNAALMPPKQWHRMKWTPGHGRPLPASFWTTPDKAIEAALAIEAKNPLVIPAPYRDKVAAAPRDAALRMEMAACEVKVQATRRRGAYDAALALLLGAPAAQAERLIVAGSEIKFDRFFCNEGMPCQGKDAICEPGANRCLGPADRAYSWVSKDEILIEEAISRALLRNFVTHKGPEVDDEAVKRWASTMRHRCGAQLCQALYEGEGKLSMHDIRDGGTAEDHVRNVPKSASRSNCLMYTETTNYEACLDSCRRPTGRGTFISSEGCTMRCEKWCQ